MSKILDDSGNRTPEFIAEVESILNIKRLNSFLLGLSFVDISLACMELISMINLAFCEAWYAAHKRRS